MKFEGLKNVSMGGVGTFEALGTCIRAPPDFGSEMVETG
jgi:hypothetical protein